MTTQSQITTPPTPQEVCIDLPGDTVQCWRSSDHIKIILRKHRDVIFAVNLGAGKIYTIESDESPFYNTREKKIVNPKSKDVLSFKDGERLHLWITRDFKGAITLKSNGKLLMRVEPNKVDRTAYDNDPKTKAAPIIINLGGSISKMSSIPGVTPVSPAGLEKTGLQKYMTTSTAASAAVDECSVICVVDGTLKDAPKVVLDHFKTGGGESGLVDIDPNDVATRNWLYGQLAGTAAYVADNWSWLRASLDARTSKGFQLVKVKVVGSAKKLRFYFSGYSKYNNIFGPGGFGPRNERIMNILAGAGRTSSTFSATLKGVIGTFKGNALVSLIFGSATAIVEWKADAQKDGYDLASALLMSIIKAVVVAALTVLVVAAFVMLIFAAGAAAVPVIVVGAVTVAAGFVINYAVEAGDKALGRLATGNEKNGDGLSSALTPYLRKAATEIEETWDYLMKKFPNDYKELLF